MKHPVIEVRDYYRKFLKLIPINITEYTVKQVTGKLSGADRLGKGDAVELQQ